MRRQLGVDNRGWTTHIYNKIYKNKPPVPFIKSSEIIETIHKMMIEHLITHKRPIQIKKSIGYLELSKTKPQNGFYMTNWKKSKELHKRVKELNHHTNGYIYKIEFRFSGYGNWRLFKYRPLRKHNRYLAKRIFDKDV